MQVETVDIHEIHADPANVRRHPERNLSAIKASLARFGQQRPILVDDKGIVRAGNGTLAAARELGWTEINVVRTPLQGSEATAYAIADNRTAELAEWDETGLAEQLRALQSEDFDLAALGYDADELDRIVEGLGTKLIGETVDDPQGEWEGMPEFQNEPKAIRTIPVHFREVASIQRFSELLGIEITEATKYLYFPK